MGFRNERAADRYRIDALEDEVAAKDDEIERLRAKLEANNAPKPQKKQTEKKGTMKNRSRGASDVVPVVDDLPSGDVMSVDTHDPTMWKVGLGWVAVAAITFGVLGAREGLKGIALPAAIFGLPGFFFLVRTRLVLDRKARTITRVWSLLLSVRRTLSVEGQDLVLERRRHQPKDGNAWYGGHLLLGDRPLASKKITPARVMAKRVAAFMGMPLGERDQSAKDIMRQAQQPLRLTLLLVVGFGALLGLMKLVGVIP